MTRRPVRFRAGTAVLASELVLPRELPAPAVLLIAGSGPIDRNENHRRIRLNVLNTFAERRQTSTAWLGSQKPSSNHIVPDLTHILLRDPGLPTLSTYKQQTEKTIDAEVVEIVLRWLERHVRANRQSAAP